MDRLLISVWSEQRFYPSSGHSILSTSLFHRQKMTPIYQIQSGDLVVPSVIIPFSVFAMKLLVKATAVGILCRICSLCEKSIEFPDFSSILSLVLSHRQKTSSIYLIHHSDFVVLWVIILQVERAPLMTRDIITTLTTLLVPTVLYFKMQLVLTNNLSK